MLKQNKDFIIICEPNIINKCFALKIDFALKIKILKKIYIFLIFLLNLMSLSVLEKMTEKST